jgi:hypothetical protein
MIKLFGAQVFQRILRKLRQRCHGYTRRDAMRPHVDSRSLSLSIAAKDHELRDECGKNALIEGNFLILQSFHHNVHFT